MKNQTMGMKFNWLHFQSLPQSTIKFCSLSDKNLAKYIHGGLEMRLKMSTGNKATEHVPLGLPSSTSGGRPPINTFLE